MLAMLRVTAVPPRGRKARALKGTPIWRMQRAFGEGPDFGWRDAFA